MAEDLKLSVGLDASSVKKSSSNLKKEIDNIFKQASGKDVSSNFQKLQTQMDKAASRATVLEQKMKELENTKIPTEDYKQLESSFNNLSGQLGRLTDKQIEMQEAGQTTGKAWDDLANKIARVNAELENVTAEMSQMKAEGTAFTSGVDTAQYENLKNQLEGVNNQMRILTSSAYQSGEVSRNAAERTGSVWQNTGNMIKQTFADLKSGKIFKELGQQGENCAKKISSAFIKLPGKISAFTNALKSSKSHMSNLGNSAGKVLKKILLLGFGIRGLVGLFRKLRSGISEGLQAMAQWNSGNNATNKSISMLVSSLNYLKASLATAFAPILSVVAPILSTFINMLAKAVQMVGAFFAALTGKGTYTAAIKKNTNYASGAGGKSGGGSKKNTAEEKQKKAQEKYNKKVVATEQKNAKAMAKAEEKQAKAADKLAKKQEKANDKLADFDDLNVLGVEAVEDLEDAQADLAEMPEYEAPDLGDLDTGGGGTPPIAGFEEKQIPEWVNNLVDKIKDAWKNADFTDIGRMVGEKMRDALNKASDWLVGVAQPFAYKLGKSIATFLNGFFETPGLATALGKTIGELINTAIIGINAFLDFTHFKSIGKFIGDALNSAVQTIDWKGIGHMLAQGINALSGMLLGFVKSFDFKGFGKALADGFMQMVRDIDIEQIFAALSGALAGIIEFISGTLQGLDWWELGNTIVQWCVDAVKGVDWNRLTTAWYEMLGSAVGALLGFAGGIGEKVTQLFIAVVNSVKAYFQQKTKEAGGNIFLGILKGIVDAVNGITQWVYDHIFKPFWDGICDAFDMHSPSKVMENAGKMIMQGLFDGISAFIQKIVDLFTKLKDDIMKIWNAFKAIFEKVTGDIKFNIGKIWNDMKTNVENTTEKLKEKVREIIQAMKDKVEPIVENLKKNFVTFWENIKTSVETIAGNIRDNVSKAIETLYNKTVGPEGWITKLKKHFIDAWEAIKKGIETPINGIKSLINGIADVAKTAVNGIIKALKAFKIELPNWDIIPESFRGKSWSPGDNLNYLAQGAVIPPNKEFLAVLGDQKTGTNIETPLSTMIEAFKTAMQDMNISNTNQNAIMTLDGQTFARLMVPYVMNEMNRRGYNVNVLEG